ncbi:ATP-dependent DNA helicase PIF1 [Pectinophora gossypiella]|uniref:ATP-dependent DNA helicase PIF1 n=1 Tax=Pectinophora gossypiella TaxID=13191 RepID=UPI00214F2697|nr:ATP-dependent DNA helicase PIF1 [Pectinophora gossypiella]
MEGGETFLSCAATLEWITPQGSISRKVSYKTASLRLIRNEFREMFMEVSSEKNKAIRLALKGINVFKKFMAEGKASVKFQEAGCTLFISNAPPTNLVAFLRTIFVKMTGDKEANSSTSKQTMRSKLLSGKAQAFEDISPVTVTDMHNAKSKISRATVTTPSPPSKKRKCEDVGKGPAPKKLYSPSPLTTMSSLNAEQQRVLEACLGGRNIFFTGSAGTGKSFLLKRIVTALPPDVTVATASTGVAACHIGGTTLHAFAGIGDGSGSVDILCDRAMKLPLVAQKWRKCKHLIIDEISMVDGLYFEKLEAVARFVRKNDKPFGGIQLILCGDFLQLPPVVDKSKTGKRFCFQSPCWDKCIELCFELKEVHRQKDQEFISILNSIRIGRVTKEISDRLLGTARQKIESDGILATRLCSHTNDSKMINDSKLKDLDGEEKVFSSQDSDNATKLLDMQTIAPSKLVIKVGAQVMLLKNVNVNAGLVNGARGVVVRYDEGFPVVRFKNKKEYTARTERWYVKNSNGTLLCRRQIPLNLAWAFSIHKSQGLTLDCVEMSLSKIFEAGQAYVALSRAQSLDTLRVLDFDSRHVWADTSVLEFYQKFRRRLQQMEIIPLGRPLADKTNKKLKLREILEKQLRRK